MRKLLYRSEKGNLGQYEDWWYLVVGEDGSEHIEHEWDHVRLNGLAQNEGTEVLTIDQCLANCPSQVRLKIKEILGRE